MHSTIFEAPDTGVIDFYLVKSVVVLSRFIMFFQIHPIYKVLMYFYLEHTAALVSPSLPLYPEKHVKEKYDKNRNGLEVMSKTGTR